MCLLYMERKILYRFFEGKASLEEEKEVCDWTEASEENMQEYIKERKYFDLLLVQNKKNNTPYPSSGKVYLLNNLIKYAAVVLLLIMCGLQVYYITKPEKNSEMNTITVPTGQRVNLLLSDGTNVWLNSGSKMRYPASFTKGKREVTLDGEGYFEVAKDTTSRFIVKAGEIEVEALGTTFNVKAYQEDGELTTTLFEGKVRTSVGKDEVILKPDESLSFDKSSRRMIVSDDLAAYARMWKDNELVFKGATMEEVAVMLDRLYNVKVRFASEKVKHYRFSGVIKNNSLDNVIELISLTAPIMYKKVGGEIIIEERK